MNPQTPLPLLLALLALLALLPACHPSEADEAGRRQELARLRLARLQEESRLVFVDYTLREICGSKDQTVWRVLGDKEVLYSLTAHVTAGLETSRIRPDALEDPTECSLHAASPQAYLIHPGTQT